MTEAQPNRQQELEELLSERKKFEAWLAQLEARRESAASHVFERVHSDYAKRLDDVRKKLAAEADAIAALIEELAARLATEQEKVTLKTDERAEAELRALVGEYSEKEWNSTRAKLDAAIADRRAKFDATERELAELKDLLLNVHGAPAPRPSVMQAAAVAVEDDLEEATRADAAAGGAVTTDAAATDARTGASATAGEVVEVTEVEADADVSAATLDGAQALSATDVGAVDEAAPQSPGFDELAFLRSVAGTPSSPLGTSPVTAKGPRPAGKSADRAKRPIQEPPSRPSASTATVPPPAEPSPLGAPTPRTSQAIRSLKCQECGTLNFPTEWYCERCGGELAAF